MSNGSNLDKSDSKHNWIYRNLYMDMGFNMMLIENRTESEEECDGAYLDGGCNDFLIVLRGLVDWPEGVDRLRYL
jgi:hypothetical protein